MSPAILVLKLKHVTKQSLPQKHQVTVSHIPLQTMFIWVKIMDFFLFIYMNSLNCGSKDAGSVQDNSFCGWDPCLLLSKGKFHFVMGTKLYYLSSHLP